MLSPKPPAKSSNPESDTREYRGLDRRKQPTPALSRYTFIGGRRFHHRRAQEATGAYVDLYSQKLVLFLLIFFTLTVIDSVSTLIYLEKGGREFNPVAQWMIDRGDTFFILCKGILTAICILFIMVHKNFKYSRFAIFTGFSFYFLLTIYHIVLQIKAIQ
ncbi:MAG: DUF5658 family protein [Planctomycetota bacterium]